ncbi:hypothetical protein OsJ_10076 [Oryza sativa Japonica Group]|uniref:Inositol polyphosphate-related phosphatase domain-containing protein n=1 Tax=Oryza sativa subsp. japonica TaxID=39947 RepID=A3AFX0_ORYSJ|nr:hypothetical protein OsJ_10076 [Oryza sativa Japonica Group]
MLENQRQAEVLWPRLVANKLFRKPSGSHAFVADFPMAVDDDFDGEAVPAAVESFDDDGCSPDADACRSVKRPRPRPQQRASNKTLKYRLFASTWNVGGVAPPDDLDLSDWLDTRNAAYDIYVLGFQEVVPLSARNVLGADKKRVGMRWNELVRAALNRSSPSAPNSSRDQREAKGTGCGAAAAAPGGGEIKQQAAHQKVHRVRGGIGGVCGELACRDYRAPVSVRFWLHDTSFCVACCHLASGGRDGDVAHRNADATEILSRTTFPRGHSLNLPQKILDHDRVILLGDLNYRISLPEAKTSCEAQVESEGGAFHGWNEGAIAFSPTYKYYPNSDTYYGCASHGRKGEKRRAPAWCDRILWRGAGLKQKRYDRCESRLSDHRPVRALFEVEVGAPRRNLNSLRSFFLSERFDGGRSAAADLLREDGTASSARFGDTI